MQPTSEMQFQASEAGVVPGLEQVRDDVWALGVGMPGQQRIPYSLLYLLRDERGAIHVIDPGWDTSRNWSAFETALADIGATVADVASITATHFHPDHIGMAGRVRDASGAPLQLLDVEAKALTARSGGSRSADVVKDQLEQWGVPSVRRAELESILLRQPDLGVVHPDRVLRDGDRLDVPGFDLIAMLTPGHTSGHLCIRDDARSLIFTGDHVLPTMYAGIGLGGATSTNAVNDYLTSLNALFGYTDHEVLPGHGYRFFGLQERAQRSGQHHLRRSLEVAAVLEKGGSDASAWEIASQLTWASGWETLDGFYVFSALLQTVMHREFVEQGGVERFIGVFGAIVTT